MLDVDIAGKRGEFDYAVGFKSTSNVTALFGVSGSGKSTIVDAVAGHLKPENGRIAVDETIYFDAVGRKNIAIKKRRIGYIFQDARLFPHMNVKRNLTYARWAGRRSKKGTSFDDVVGLLGLEDLLSRFPANLSGGEKQRVAIGRALLSDPRILLMDEPLTGLDYQRKSEIMPYLEKLARDGGVPILYVSHDLDEILQLAGHLVLVREGRVLSEGPIAEVLPKISGQFDQAKHVPNTLVNAYFDSVDETYPMTWLKIGQQRFAVPNKVAEQTQPYRLRFDASDVAIALAAPVRSSFQNILSGRVLSVQHSGGAYSDVTVSVDGQLVISRITRRAADKLDLKADLSVYLMIKSVAIDGLL